MAPTVNMHEAKTGLSKLVADIETGKETEIILARNGKPVARLVPIEQPAKKKRLLGIAEGMFGELDENWYQEFQALDKVVIEQLEARWDRLDRLYGEEEQDGKKSA